MLKSIHIGRVSILLVALLLVGLPSVMAQSDRVLLPFTPVTGTLASGGSDDWSYTSAAGAVISLFARSSDGTLDPVVSVLEGEDVLIANDDYAYPETRDSGIEAITLARAGTYTIRVSAFGSTAGAYSLVILLGYGDDALVDEFDSPGAWEADSQQSEIALATVNSQLELTLNGLEQSGSVLNTLSTTFDRFYASAEFDEVRGRGGWQVSLLGRMVTGTGYAFELNSQGLWRVTRRTGTQAEAVRDWTTHPAILAGQDRFRLGMLAYGENLDLFYNDQYIGTVRDGQYARPGGIGIGLRTGGALDSTVMALLDSVSVTIPVSPAIFPNQVQVTSDGSVMTRDLERRGVLSALPALNVAESFVDLSRAGVTVLPLARGESYARFAYAANIVWESGYENAPAGCGLVFGFQDETNYTLAYVMQGGSYGVSPRLGEIFAPGIAGVLPTPLSPPAHLMVVVNDDGLHYFVRGVLVGSLVDAATTTGGIGIGVVNEAPLNTTCRFRDVWLADVP